MPNKKFIILLVFLVIIALVILFVKILYVPKEYTTSPSVLLPQFSVLSPLSSNTEISVTEKIVIRFSRPVDPKSLELELIPVNDIKLSFDSTSTELTVEPTNAWAFSTEYFIKIPQTTKSMDGSNLEGDYTYAFKTYPYSGI